jgi:GNAT superfamily N-acetyltransferase
MTQRMPEQVRIRAIEPGDAPGLERFYASLSDESRCRRFLGWTAGLPAAGSTRFCAADHAHREGFVALLEPAAPVPGEIVGHLCVEPDGAGAAEIAIAVADRLQGRGIGRRLMEAGVHWARESGIATLSATTYAWNGRLVHLVTGLDLPIASDAADSGTVRLSIDLTASGPGVRRRRSASPAARQAQSRPERPVLSLAM